MNRLAAFIPAAVLGFALGLGINAWRHRQSGNDSPPAASAPKIETVPSPAAPEPDIVAEPPIADAAEFVQKFTGTKVPSPLRSQMDKEALAAGLTLDAFLAMIRDGTVPPGLWESDALRERLRVWAAADRQRFLDIAPGLPESASRACMDAALKGLTASELRTFMADWAKQPRLLRQSLFEKAIAAVARKDPAGALALLSELPLNAKEKESITASTFASLLGALEEKPAEWGRMFQTILETAKGQPADRMRRFFGEAIGGITAKRAVAVWPAIRDADVDVSLKREFLGKWAHSDPDAALAQAVEFFPSANAAREAQSLYEDLATQSSLRMQLLDETKGRDVKTWLALADKVPPGPGREAFMAGLTNQAASGNPALAVQLLPHVSQEHRAQTINMIAELWTARDAVAASQWVDSLPPGAERDQAAAGFVRRLAESDPERAAQWAVTIQDESNRRHALQKVHQTWQRLNPAAVAQWMQSEARLTAEDHAALDGQQ